MGSESDGSRPPLAHYEMVLFIEETRTGDRRLVGIDEGNFLAPREILAQAKAMLTLMIDFDTVPLGTQVGIVQVLGRGPDKQVTVHCEPDETVTIDDYEYDHEQVTSVLSEFGQ